MANVRTLTMSQTHVDACDSMNVYHLSVGPPDAWRSPAKDAKKVSNAIKSRFALLAVIVLPHDKFKATIGGFQVVGHLDEVNALNAVLRGATLETLLEVCRGAWREPNVIEVTGEYDGRLVDYYVMVSGALTALLAQQKALFATRCQVRMLIWQDELVDGVARAQVCLRGRSYGVKYVAGIIRALEVVGQPKLNAKSGVRALDFSAIGGPSMDGKDVHKVIVNCPHLLSESTRRTDWWVAPENQNNQQAPPIAAQAVPAPVLGKRQAEEAGPSFGSIRGPVSQSTVLAELEKITDSFPIEFLQGYPLWWAADIKYLLNSVCGPWMLWKLLHISRHPDLDEKDVVKGVLEAVARVVESEEDDKSVCAFLDHCGRNRQTNLLTEMLLEPFYARPLIRIFHALIHTDEGESLGCPLGILRHALGLWEAVESETREVDLLVEAVRLVTEICDGDDGTGSLVVHALHLGMTTQIICTVAKHPTEEAVMTIVSQLITMVWSHQCVNRLLEDPFYRAMEGVALHHRGAKPAHKDVINQAYNCLTEGRQILQEAAE